MAERIVSPGVFTREKDLSFLPQGISEIGAALIGPTQKGPAFTPTQISNFSEFEEIFGKTFNEQNLLSFAKELQTNVVVTLGEKGCAYVEDNSVTMFETESVNTIDTTGAGDAFVGAFSYALANNLNISDSIKLALEKATNSVTKKGTQSSYKD